MVRLLDSRYAKCAEVIVVCDNLNTDVPHIWC